MGRLTAVIFGVILGGAAVYSAHEYHLVRARGEFLLVKKKAPTWKDVYVDVRHWSMQEWSTHRELAQNMAAAGHSKHILRGNDGPFPTFRGSYRESPFGQQNPYPTRSP